MEWLFQRQWMQRLAATVQSLGCNFDRHIGPTFASTRTNHQQSNLSYISRQKNLEPAGKTTFQSAGKTLQLSKQQYFASQTKLT